MTQRDMVLQYMRDTGSITPMDALNEFGCMRLAARIDELKRRGVEISTDMESRVNRYGKRVSYARYSISSP